MVYIVVIGTVITGLVIGARKISNRDLAVASLKQRIVSKYGINELYVSSEFQSLLGFNFSAHKILLGSLNHEKQYEFSQIAAVEVVENGTSVTQTNRGSQLLGAAVGAVAFGPLGVVIGGLSGKSQSRGRVRGISLKVTVDDSVCPIYMISFLRYSSKKGLDPDSAVASSARQNVDRFHAHLVNAMRESQSRTIVRPVSSSADELQKLWELKQAGILTADEFGDQKARILSRSEPDFSAHLRLSKVLSEPSLEIKKGEISHNSSQCRHCGKLLREDDRFCDVCGMAARRDCESCGNPLGSDDRFCDRCGSAVVRLSGRTVVP